MYSPFGSISGAIHLFARRPVLSMAVVVLAVVLELGMKVSEPAPPPPPPAPSVPAIAYIVITPA